MLELTKQSTWLFFIDKQWRHKTLTCVNILKFLHFESCVQHCRHIETQSNNVITGAYILIRAPTEELDNSEYGWVSEGVDASTQSDQRLFIRYVKREIAKVHTRNILGSLCSQAG